MAGAFDPVPSLRTFTPGARWTLELARQEAPRLNHGFIGTEHVLLSLLALEDGVVPNVLKSMGVDREGVRRQIENWVSSFPTSKMPGRAPYNRPYIAIGQTGAVNGWLFFWATDRDGKLNPRETIQADYLLSWWSFTLKPDTFPRVQTFPFQIDRAVGLPSVSVDNATSKRPLSCFLS